jgi:DNA-binding NtrC family response regulator
MAKILLVDDDPLEAFARKSALQSSFHDVERVNNAAEALCLIQQPHFKQSFGLVISGLHMPGVLGPAFVAELHSRVPSMPVMVLGNGREEAADYDGEWVRFLSRPVANKEMLAAADQLLTPVAFAAD